MSGQRFWGNQCHVIIDTQIVLRWPCSQVDIIQQAGEALCNMQSNQVNQVKHNAMQYKSQNEQKVHSIHL